jgi:hypothetical protein
MSELQNPITVRDFSGGRISKSAVNNALTPANSVSNAVNVDFSDVIGAAIVRKGNIHNQQIAVLSTDGQANRISSNTDAKIYGAVFKAQTFTPSTGQERLTSINIQLRLTGEAVGNVTVSLQTTSAGKPTGTVLGSATWTFPAGNIRDGFTMSLPQPPGLTTLTAGTVYAIVITYPGGDGTETYIRWAYNNAATYAGGVAQTSSDSGGTWSDDAGSLYFAERIVDTSTAYNLAPLGNYSFLNKTDKKNVVGFEINDGSLLYGSIYYYNSGWLRSNYFVSNSYYTSSPTAKMRFANLNGSVFVVNGVNSMKSSVDFGKTWITTNCIFPYDISSSTPWSSTANYTTAAFVWSGSSFYQSLQNNNLNKSPSSNPTWWSEVFPLVPSLIIISNNRILVSGVNKGPTNSGGFPSRIYFSSIVDPVASPFITWNTDATTGDWIDINPDDGGIITAFAKTSTLTLVFKNNAMYRLNTISKTVDSENIFNVGAVSQEAVTSCLGMVYFYSGNGIYQTDGTFPQNISRIGVQDFIDEIADPLQVYSWNDEYNVYFSIGDVTLTLGPEDTRSYRNVVLKFSPRDQNWSVFTYGIRIAQTTQFGVPPADILATQYDGYLANLNVSGTTDDGKAIPYSLESQELEFGNRAHTKNISDKIVVYNKNGGDSVFLMKEEDGSYKQGNTSLTKRVNVCSDVNYKGHFFTFRWQGEALGSRPILEGYHFPKVTDLGVINQ